jgi:hypothetical protein
VCIIRAKWKTEYRGFTIVMRNLSDDSNETERVNALAESLSTNQEVVPFL